MPHRGGWFAFLILNPTWTIPRKRPCHDNGILTTCRQRIVSAASSPLAKILLGVEAKGRMIGGAHFQEGGIGIAGTAGGEQAPQNPAPKSLSLRLGMDAHIQDVTLAGSCRHDSVADDFLERHQHPTTIADPQAVAEAVSYTHLTLPTILRV